MFVCPPHDRWTGGLCAEFSLHAIGMMTLLLFCPSESAAPISSRLNTRSQKCACNTSRAGTRNSRGTLSLSSSGHQDGVSHSSISLSELTQSRGTRLLNVPVTLDLGVMCVADLWRIEPDPANDDWFLRWEWLAGLGMDVWYSATVFQVRVMSVG
jgi:hypothetical protein